MKTYALLDSDGGVHEVIPPLLRKDGSELPISERFHPDFVAKLVEYDPENPPAPVAPAGRTHAELVEQAKAAMRSQRQPIISALDGLQTSALVTGMSDLAVEIETVKQGLRDITDIDLSACVTYEEMHQAAKSRLAQLSAALPANVRTPFLEATS